MDDFSPKIVEEEKSIPTNLASFKMDLQEDEKKAKLGLVLPYTLYVDYFYKKKIIHIYWYKMYVCIFFRVQNTSNPGAMIHYVPDEADDWDEEDPDDDLEI